MPTVLMIRGWRLFFYSNELDEPMHIHARKAETECKFWLNPDIFEIEEAYSHNFKPQLRKEIRKIIFDHLDDLIEAWENRWEK